MKGKTGLEKEHCTEETSAITRTSLMVDLSPIQFPACFLSSSVDVLSEAAFFFLNKQSNRH